MAFDYAAAAALLLEPQPAIAVIKGWNRLEGRPRAVNFERALRAEVRDPLWFLTRQWQFGEFTGDDAASPVDVRTRMGSAPFARYTPGTAAAVAYDAGVPLETRVEAERIPADLVTHVQVTRYFFGLVAGQARAALLRSVHLDPAAYGLAADAVEGADDADARAARAFRRQAARRREAHWRPPQRRLCHPRCGVRVARRRGAHRAGRQRIRAARVVAAPLPRARSRRR
jgi:hypothetical protein